ncbi:hypothetical protein A3D78_01265 [Candidatus Gottesmanbacteria bacterium RIFCSPHIGHO2_02_FULL_39_14]|uniref:Succinylglutamate desuccinylase/Aspartoacylase catalytic domain-containing protein n=1 Tax=Candidatus Gottesmanbacteria bacterium RIFCSPHIGHO2_02_FULL_39_14 TaxID=1798383 RepID=A0A1F6A3N2_9BACT|nr:MAG: hypothetical protein A3D78_01265 [Candidatus Gottesmanbacteria bacterium RIFCSPHIGHO2_02_FULL_39_14]
MIKETIKSYYQEHLAPDYDIGNVDSGHNRNAYWLTTELTLKGTDAPVTGFFINSPHPGPVIFGVSGIHGDEGDGIEANRKAAEYFRDNLSEGSYLAVLDINSLAFRAQQRISTEPGFNQNLNNLFGIDNPVTPLGKHASALFNLIVDISEKNSDPLVVVDLHSEGRSDRSIPYIRIDRTDDPELQESLLCLGLVSGLPMVMEFENLAGENIENALSTALVKKKKIPALTIEVGSGSDLNDENITRVTQAIERIGNFLKMTHGPLEIPKPFFQPNLHRLTNIYAYYMNGSPVTRRGKLFLIPDFTQARSLRINHQWKGGHQFKPEKVGFIEDWTLNVRQRMQSIYPGLDPSIHLNKDQHVYILSVLPEYQQFDPKNPICIAAIEETDPELLRIYNRALHRIRILTLPF